MNELTLLSTRNKLIRKLDYSDRTMTLDLDVTDRLEILVYDLMHMQIEKPVDEDTAKKFINSRFRNLFGHVRIRKTTYITTDLLESFKNDLKNKNGDDLGYSLYLKVIDFIVNELNQLIKFKDSEDGSCMKMIQINYIVDDMIVSFAFDKFDRYALFDGNRMRLTVV